MNKTQKVIIIFAIVLSYQFFSEIAFANVDSEGCKKRGDHVYYEFHQKYRVGNTWYHYAGSPYVCPLGSTGTIETHHGTKQCRTCNQPCKAEWGGWSACSKPQCGGGGTQTRTQTCTGKKETRKCNTGTCCTPEWGEWSDCTSWCGGGTRSRSQTCTGVTEQESCNLTPCPTPGECILGYENYNASVKVVDSPMNSSDAKCKTGEVIDFSGSGTDSDPWKWDCTGLNGGGNAHCLAVLKKGTCGTATNHVFTYPDTTWGTYSLCKPESAISNPNPVKPLTLDSNNPVEVSTTWTCSTANGTNGNTCSATLKPPTVDCGSANNKTEINTPPTSNLCSTNASETKSPYMNSAGRWEWSCKYDGGGLNLTKDSCSAPSCLAGDPLKYQSYLYLKQNSNNQTVKVSAVCNGNKMCCDIEATDAGSGDSKTHICTGEGSKEIIIPNSGTYPAKCYIDDNGCEATGSCPTVNKELKITTMCLQKECNAQGSCQATPVAATDLSQCSSTCNSNADCSNGRIIETRP